MIKRLAFSILAIAVVSIVASSAHADSWRLPKTETYFSSSGALRLTVVPRALASQLEYFDDKGRGREPAGQRVGGRTECRALLERKTEAGGWVKAWEQTLLNEVAPVSALVADSGEYAVTFDNWHSMGFGATTVVIYGIGGRLIRALGLRDFLPEEHIKALPHSVSSIHWGRNHALTPDGQTLVLNVVERGQESYTRTPRFVQIHLRLSDGSVLPSPVGK